MGRRRAIKVLSPQRPLRAGKTELLEVHLRIPDAVEVVETSTVLEGRCRCSFSGQDCMHILVSEIFNLPIQPLLVPSTKGTPILPSGSFRLPLLIRVPSHLPGTFTAKHGAIAYRIIVKLTLKRLSSSDSAVLETERPVDVIGIVEAEPNSLLSSVNIDRHVKKKIFCFNRLDANVSFEIDRSSFVVGEHILVNGQVINNHSTNVIKHLSIELRQKVQYSSGAAKRTDTRLISRLICGSVSPAETFPLHHSLQIPGDCYPSLSIHGNPIQVSYVLLVRCSGLFEIETPIFLGNLTGISSRRSIEYADSCPDKSSSSYYCVPPTEFSYSASPASTMTANQDKAPPPYSSNSSQNGARPVFIPIHMLNTPYRQFTPMFGMGGFPTRGPPKYSGPPSPRFLKIEEIE